MSRLASALPVALVLVAACSGDSTGPRVDTGTGGTPANCSAADDTKPLTTVAVGEVKVLSGNDANCVRLAGSGTSQYVAIVGNVGRGAEQVTNFKLVTDAPSAAAMSGDVALRAELARAAAASADMHPVHRHFMESARRLDIAAERAAVRSAAAGPGGMSVRGAIFTGTPTVGQSASIRVPSVKPGDAPCSVFSTITATVKHVSSRAIIVQDDASPSAGFSDADFQAIAAEFNALIYAADTSFFGTGSDVDANSGRIVILYTPEVNKATPRTSQSLLAGFFWAGDLFRTGCAQSNQGELFYLLVPDPTGIHSGVRTVADVREKTRGTIAHEFEHMLNAGWRLSNAPTFESVWLDEALAHFAEEVVGRAKLGVGDFAELSHAQVFDAGNNLRDYNAFFFQNLARFDDWLRNPGAKSPISQQADTSLAVRGSAWALLRYAVDHYSNNSARAFTRSFVTTVDSGVVNLRNRVGGNARVDSLLTGWMVANHADDLPIAGLAARYGYRSWRMREAVTQAANNGGVYPLQLTSLLADGTTANGVRTGGGARYFRFPIGAGQFGALQLTNAEGTTAGFPDGRLILLRTQ